MPQLPLASTCTTRGGQEPCPSLSPGTLQAPGEACLGLILVGMGWDEDGDAPTPTHAVLSPRPCPHPRWYSEKLQDTSERRDKGARYICIHLPQYQVQALDRPGILRLGTKKASRPFRFFFFSSSFFLTFPFPSSSILLPCPPTLSSSSSAVPR